MRQFFLLIWLLLIPVLFLAQEYNFQTISLREGLLNSQVNAIAKDPAGYMWFGTMSGVSRYDGFEMKNYSVDDSLCNNRVRSLAFLNNHLVIGTDHGLSIMKDGGFNNFHLLEFESQTVNKILVLEETLLLLTDHGILELVDSTVSKLEISSVIDGSDIKEGIVTEKGNVWVATSHNGVFRLDKTSDGWGYSNIQLPQEIIAVSSLYQDSEGVIWIGSMGTGVYRVSPESIDKITFPKKYEAYYITSIYEDVNGSMLFGSWANGLVKFNGISFEKIDENGGLKSNQVVSLYADEEGLIWIGTLSNGIQLLEGMEFVFYSSSHGLPDDNIRGVALDSEGDVWVSTLKGIARITSGNVDTTLVPENSGNRYGPIVKFTQDEMLAGSYDGELLRMRLDMTYELVRDIQLQNSEIISIHPYKGGALVGTLNDGLYFYNGASVSRVDKKRELEDRQIWAICEKRGDVFIGTDNGLARMKPDGSVSFPGSDRQEITTSKITSISADAKFLYMTTDGRGLWRMEIESERLEHLQKDEGITSNQIFSSVWLDESNLMLTNQMGLDRIRFFPSKHVVESYHVDFGEGLEFNTNVIAKGVGENLWIGCNEGLLLYDPTKAINFLKQPDLHINEVRVMQEQIDWEAEDRKVDANESPADFVLPYDRNYLTFLFQGIHFSKYENIRYQYRLIGRDDLWSQSTRNNEATFSNLSNGEYIFEVRCTIDGGKTFSKTRSVQFIISPPYYKTWWFFVLLVIGILLIIYSFSRAFKRVQSQTVNYSTLQQSLGTNRLMILFIGTAYPAASIVNNFIDKGLNDSQLVVSIVVGVVGLLIFVSSFYVRYIRTNLGLFVTILFIAIEAHILALLVANNLAPSIIIGFVMTTSFASVVFNTLRSYFVFALSIFAGIILIALFNETVQFNRFQFVMVGFWTLMIVSLLIIVKLNLFRKLRLSDTILEKGDSIILVRNDKGNIIYASSSVEEKLGYKLDQVYGDGWWRLREEHDGITKEEIIGDIEYTGGTRIYTNAIADSKGEKKYFNWTDTRIEGGLVIGVGQDVTSLREYQKELEKLSVIASKTDSGVVLMDADNKVEWVNEAFEEMTGYSFAEFKGRRPGDVLAGKDTDTERMNQSREDRYQKKTYQMELLGYKKNGEPMWLSINHTPIFKEGTDELQWQVNMVQDITKSKDRQEEMKRLSMVATKTDNYVLISDKEDRVLWVNDSFEKIFKYKAREVIGKTTSTFFKTAEYNPQLIKKLRREVFDKKVPFVGELTDVDANGDHLWLAVNITPILGADGEIEQIISLGSDITDKKLDEFRLNEYSKSLELMHEIDNVLLDEKTEEQMFRELLGVVINSNSLYVKVSLMIFDDDMEFGDNYYIEEDLDEIVYEQGIDMSRLRSYENMKTGEPLIVQDLENNPISKSDHDLLSVGVKSYIMVPMIVDNKVAGSLNVGGKYPFMFIDDEVKVIKDISNSLSVAYKQRKQAKQISESEDNFRQLNESLKEVFWLFDQENSRMIYVSQAYQTIFGRSPESLMESPLSWMDAIVADDRMRIQRLYLDQIFIDGFDEQFQINHPIEGVKWVHSTAIPIRNDEGDVIKVSGFTEDITELKHKEEELGYLNTKLASISSINESILRNEPFGSVLIDSLKGLISDQFEIMRLTLALFDFDHGQLSFFRIDNELKSVSGESEKFSLKYFRNIDRLRKGETVVVNNLEEVEDKSDSDDQLIKSGAKSYILVPLISDRELIGSLNLAFSGEGEFDEDFISGLRDVANGISLSIHQMQLKSIIEGDKEELELKNKNITASINYAKRIQQAYLPETGFIKKFFSDAHLFYQAKDIVSGDFYWWTLKNNKLIMVVADCTGHGVPGGFMTILGSQTIANIVSGKSITDPGLLLKVLDLEIQYALNKSDEELRDGMDVAVCSIDLTSHELTYAGARRPLMYITEKQLFEIKGTTRSIGEDELVSSTFETTTIQLRKGDRIFLFSDGVQDQFGGNLGRAKKFSKLRLQKLISSEELLEGSIEKQFEEIIRKLKEWQGDTEQTDDMILLALEF